MVFLKDYLKKLILKKKSTDDKKKDMPNYTACKELLSGRRKQKDSRVFIRLRVAQSDADPTGVIRRLWI